MAYSFVCMSDGKAVSLEIPDECKRVMDFANRLRDPFIVRYLNQFTALVTLIAESMEHSSMGSMNDVRIERLKDHIKKVIDKMFPHDEQQSHAYMSNISEVLDRAVKSSRESMKDQGSETQDAINSLRRQLKSVRDEYIKDLTQVEGKWNTGENRKNPKAWIQALEISIGLDGEEFDDWINEESEHSPFAGKEMNTILRTLTSLGEYCYFDDKE